MPTVKTQAQKDNGNVQDSSKRRNSKILRGFLTKSELDTLGDSIAFLGADSAKVLKSGKTFRKWYNVILYLSPADRAFASFLDLYGEATARKVIAAVREAAAVSPEWKPFARVSSKAWSDAIADWKRIKNHRGVPDPDYKLPNSHNQIRPFTLCPFASAGCRAVCLNTSGKGADDVKDNVRRSYYQMAKATKLKPGVTYRDDLKYFWLLGIKKIRETFGYGGERRHSPQATRQRRTHAMWLSWAHEGVLDNSFNRIIYEEALAFRAMTTKRKKKMALRLNGTSDVPVHTLKVAGKNLMVELGKRGIVFYDYTKDHRRMMAWLDSKAWAGVEPATSRKVSMRGSFPTNYYLSFSWSEINGIRALQVLKRGGNVVMVFVPSARQMPAKSAKEREKQLHLYTPQFKKAKGVHPDQIRVAQLSKRPEDRSWVASVIDGDMHDLRFMDKFSGLQGSGSIVALGAKGKAAASYNRRLRKKAWERFTNPIYLMRLAGGGVRGIIRTNPNDRREDSLVPIIDLDRDIFEQTMVRLQNARYTTTAMGT